jgi:hypothetical protein
MAFFPFAFRMVLIRTATKAAAGRTPEPFLLQPKVAEGTGQGPKVFRLKSKTRSEKLFLSLTLDPFPMRPIHTPCQNGKNNSLWGTASIRKTKEK